MLAAVVLCVLMTSASGFHSRQQQLDLRYMALRDVTWLDTEWILVYRLAGGAKMSSYYYYMDSTRNDDRLLARAFRPFPCFDPSVPSSHCHQHYRSALLNDWPSDFIDQVRLSLIEGEQEVAYILFNGTGSTTTSWFSRDRVLNSSWTDLKTESQNYFSIEGHYRPTPSWTHSRRFYVFRNYGGCPRDNGWLSVQDQQVDVCSWGNLNNTHPFPGILYSKLPTYVNFNTADVGRADFLMVAVKFLHE